MPQENIKEEKNKPLNEGDDEEEKEFILLTF
jgi:hypothetical protein